MHNSSYVNHKIWKLNATEWFDIFINDWKKRIIVARNFRKSKYE